MTRAPGRDVLARSLESAAGWVGDNLSAFDPFLDGRATSLVFVQRVGELAVAAYVHCCLLPGDEARAAPFVDLLDATRRRPEFSHRVVRHPAEFVLNAEVYGILRRLGRDDVAHRELVQRAVDAGLLDHVERLPHRLLDVRLALDWAGLDHPWPSMDEIAATSPLLGPGTAPSALLLDDATIYAFTHLVMFTTDFGVRPEGAAGHAVLRSAGPLLDQLIAGACLDHHWDLLGELLFSVEALQLPRTEVAEQGWQVFLGLQRVDGSFPGPDGTALADLLAVGVEGGDDDEDGVDRAEIEVAHHYHTTLVAWLTIANRLAIRAPVGPQRAAAPVDGRRTDRVQALEAFAPAHDWLLGRAEERLAAGGGEEGVLAALVIGLAVSGAALGSDRRDVETVRRLGLLLADHDGRGAAASVRTRFLVTAVLDGLGIRVPPFADQMDRAVRLFRAEDDAGAPVRHPLPVEEKRSVLAALGRCRPSDLVGWDDVEDAVSQCVSGLGRANVDRALTAIEIATRWGARPASDPAAAARARPVVLAVATANLRRYDFDTGGRALRAARAAGAEPAELSEAVGYLLLHQRPDGGFGFFGPEGAALEAETGHGDGGDQVRQLELVATVASLWTLADLAVPSLRSFGWTSPGGG